MDLTLEAFDRLLAWLDPDRDRAARKYEEIRARLIKFFVNRGCLVAEDLADETINRVAQRLPEIEQSYVGPHELYFHGVARNVYQEYRRRRPDPAPSRDNNPPRYSEQEYVCLEQCMQAFPPEERELIIAYYQEERQTRINHRRELAQRLGLTPNALRIRAWRIRERLEQCIAECRAQRGSG